MGVLNICCRLKNNSYQRFKLSDIEMEAPVITLRTNIARHLQSDLDDIDLFYAGTKMTDEKLLAAYEIKSGVTVHVMNRVIKSNNKRVDSLKTVSGGSVKGIVSSPHYKGVIEKIFSSASSLEKLFSVAPELERDQVALSYLQEPDLLETFVEQGQIEKLIAKHPAVGSALVYISSSVSEKSIGMPAINQRMQYSLDQMSDDEDMDSSTAQPITTGQLNAALASLTGQRGEASSSSGGGTAAGSGSQVISTDFFRQAMAAASSSGSQPSPVSESDLQQLREMGITDERVARQALTATGGNIQAALELIFEDGF